MLSRLKAIEKQVNRITGKEIEPVIILKGDEPVPDDFTTGHVIRITRMLTDEKRQLRNRDVC